ncbi:MAG: hypothetical protein ACPGSB_09330 [Opitutales bacterium]
MGTSYDVPAIPSARAREYSSTWSIFNDLTSPGASMVKASLFDAVSTLCGASIIPATETPVNKEVLLSVEVPQALAEIRDALSLNTVEIAKVFNVSRQAIYDWAAGKNVAPQNRERLAEVLEVAEQWQSYELGRLGPVAREVRGETSLLELLSSEVLDRVAITSQLEKIAARVAGAQTNNALPSAEDLLKRHEMSPLSGQAYRRNVKTSQPIRR